MKRKVIQFFPSSIALFLISAFILNTPSAVAQTPDQRIPFTLPSQGELKKLRSAVIETNKGELFVELYPEAAPWHVANFKYLADAGYYQNLIFSRFQPGVYIQGGAPANNINGGPGYSLPAEFNQNTYSFGSLVMARNPDLMNPERRSHGGQFRFILNRNKRQDGKHTIFGKVVAGQDILQALRKGDRINKITVYVRNP